MTPGSPPPCSFCWKTDARKIGPDNNVTAKSTHLHRVAESRFRQGTARNLAITI
jgi:hypothetical protein